MRLNTLALIFQSTPLSRGETKGKREKWESALLFQSTPLSRGETLTHTISFMLLTYFNPLPSHEGRQFLSHSLHLSAKFQSTPLSRGETLLNGSAVSILRHFNPLPSHEGRRSYPTSPSTGSLISIHSPLTRGDLNYNYIVVYKYISIHSPLTRGDGEVVMLYTADFDFNPLPSHEGRLYNLWLRFPAPYFNPLPSHEGRPKGDDAGMDDRINFNPLPSHEGRRKNRNRKW